MQNKTTTFIVFALVVIGIVVGMRFIASAEKTSAVTDPLVSCMVAQDVKFYGAFWCPHCQAQEKSLGFSRQKLEAAGLYVECSTPDGKGQTQVCVDNNIKSYPTWVFPDGTIHTGNMSNEELSLQTSCPLEGDALPLE